MLIMKARTSKICWRDNRKVLSTNIKISYEHKNAYKYIASILIYYFHNQGGKESGPEFLMCGFEHMYYIFLYFHVFIIYNKIKQKSFFLSR